MLDLTASLAFAFIKAMRGSSSVLIFVAASDSAIRRFFCSSSNIASAASFRAACSANHAVALRVALDILDAENGNAERDLDTLRSGGREGFGDEKVATGGSGGSGNGERERGREEEEAVLKEWGEGWGRGRRPVTRGGN